jgi:protein-tyrosine-phosphatase
LPRALYVLPQYVNGVSVGEQGVPDPYGGPMTAYRASVRQLLGYVDLLVNRLAEERKTAPPAG